MNKRTVFIERKDFEVYTMHSQMRDIIPPFPSKINTFAAACLEKCHPCFSAGSVYDTSLCIVNKKIMMRLIVMDALRLAEYRSLYPHKTFFIAGKPKIRVFMTAKQKTLRVTAVWLLCGLLCSSIGALNYFAQHGAAAERVAAAAAEADGAAADSAFAVRAGDSENGPAGGTAPQITADADLAAVDSFTAVIERLSMLADASPNGKTALETNYSGVKRDDYPITSALDYVCFDGFSTACVTVEKASPSFLASFVRPVCSGVSVDAGEIVYTNGKTSCTVSFSWKTADSRIAELLVKNAQAGTAESEDIVFFASELRIAVVNAGGTMRSEKISPLRMDFILPSKKAHECLRAVVFSHQKEQIRCSRFTLVRSDVGSSYRCTVEYPQINSDDEKIPQLHSSTNPDICALAYSLTSFQNSREASLRAAASPVITDSRDFQKTETKTKTDPPVGEKIGMIHRDNGQKAVFYKTSDGKIITRVEEL